jgi:hypothetical protein
MFIYKITVIPLNQVYVGLDTKQVYKQSRWKEHCKNYLKDYNTKLYKAMKEYGLANCVIDVVEDGFNSVTELALAEINYIQQFDSYRNGLNSTRGGDGLGRHVLHKLSAADIDKIKIALGNNLSEYNLQVKWANTSFEDRQELTKHLHTQEVYQKKSNTLKKFYEANPAEKEKKKIGILEWQAANRNTLIENNKKNSLLGAAKVSKKLLVEHPNGDLLHYTSKSEFQRQTGQWAKTIIEKTNQGSSHNGYKAWEQ